jgi:hypothetical protein
MRRERTCVIRRAQRQNTVADRDVAHTIFTMTRELFTPVVKNPGSEQATARTLFWSSIQALALLKRLASSRSEARDAGPTDEVW